MLRPILCMRGEEAAQLFYGGDDVTRVGSIPWTVLRLLQDKNSVQQLEGEMHRQRKAMLVHLAMNDGAVAALVERFRQRWLAHFGDRETGHSDLREVANLILTKASADWIGIPERCRDDRRLAESLARMIDNTGRPGPSACLALISRRRTERWLVSIVEAVRDDSLDLGEDRVLKTICLLYRDADGRALSTEAAAVELLNLLRPIAAISRWIVFLGLALARSSDWHERFRDGHEEEIEGFVEEGRRLYPFFPFVGARLRKDLVWREHALGKDDWLLLDLYGTTHDPRLFPQPATFNPERGLSWRNGDFRFVPQGGGRPETSHRCPGEKITVEILKETVKLVCRSRPARITPADADIPLGSIPASPVPPISITPADAAAYGQPDVIAARPRK
ncbi:cytochrome P450 [Sinorhizobium numidicum]|uniref:Cytochrome P450 n=1 Tax=Sinorhizobium numidicum TaxID=680248 RepID=A0ABY8CZY0_9HYPH|nr:cytochrome P450 [Sinorhizobium numidicum]WEX77499.1 cytochrome P450 [Sinorhizobium numidicum]WEX84159.1 cytochrome P450 [Sinorhizobium numidicum]